MSAPKRSDARIAADAAVRSGWSRLGSEFLLARRAVQRSWRTSLLVVILVLLPISVMSTALTFGASQQPTREQEVDLELGSSQARYDIVSAPDPTLEQDPREPTNWRSDSQLGWDPDAMLDDPLALVPHGIRVIDISDGGAVVKTSAGVTQVMATIGDAWDPALTGRFEVLSGVAPTSPGEAMVSPGALDRLGVDVGDTLTVTDPAATFVITGVMKTANEPRATPQIFLPRTDATATMGYATQWFTPDWQPDAAGLAAFNHQGVLVAARTLMLQPPSGTALANPDQFLSVAVPFAVILAFSGYVVVMTAGSAFSISARRQQHALAVAMSVGAPRASVFRMVLLQGSLLGLVGAVVGTALGIAAAYPLLVLLDDGNVQSFWGFSVPWWGPVGLVAFGVLAGTIAALIPARTATRSDVVSALRGASRPPTVRASRPIWGLALVVLGGVSTIIFGAQLWATADAESFEEQSFRTLMMGGMVLGPMVLQLGVMLCGHWILSAIARIPAPRFPTWRLAVRDASAHPGRVVPAFAAVAACVFIASFAVSAVGVALENMERVYAWRAPLGSLVVQMYGTDANTQALEAQAREAAALTGADRVATLRGEPGIVTENSDATLARVELQNPAPCTGDAATGIWCPPAEEALFGAAQMYAIDPVDAELVIGMPLSPAAQAVLENGGALILGPATLDGDLVVDGAVTINTWPASVPVADYTLPGAEAGEPLEVHTLKAIAVTPPNPLPYQVLISTATAAEVGMPLAAAALIGTVDTPPSTDDLDRATAQLQNLPPDAGYAEIFVEDGPPSSVPIVALIVAAAGVLVLGVSSVSLGLARVERRPDDATLVAVGATRGIRRGIAFWQAFVIVSLGTVTGTVAGVIPMLGMSLGTSDWSASDIPVPWLGILAIGLPLAIAGVNALVSPRRPDLTRRATIA